MIQISRKNGKTEMKGNLAEIASEFSRGLKLFREKIIEEFDEKTADEIIGTIFKTCKLSEQEMLKELIQSEDEYAREFALFYCQLKAIKDDGMLDFLGNLVKEMESKNDSN